MTPLTPVELDNLSQFVLGAADHTMVQLHAVTIRRLIAQARRAAPPSATPVPPPRCGAREHPNNPESDTCDKPRGHSGPHWCENPMFSWGP